MNLFEQLKLLFQRLLSKMAVSGTEKYPDPIDVYRFALRELLGRERFEYAIFLSDQAPVDLKLLLRKNFVRIIPVSNRSFKLDTRCLPEEKVRQVGDDPSLFGIPDSWQVIKAKSKTLIFQAEAELEMT